jgi:hypothetical protein
MSARNDIGGKAGNMSPLARAIRTRCGTIALTQVPVVEISADRGERQGRPGGGRRRKRRSYFFHKACP